jgi:hypothetical protein
MRKRRKVEGSKRIFSIFFEISFASELSAAALVALVDTVIIK